MYEENKSGDMSIDTLANIYFTQDLYRQYLPTDHKYYISNALFIIYAFISSVSIANLLINRSSECVC